MIINPKNRVIAADLGRLSFEVTTTKQYNLSEKELRRKYIGVEVLRGGTKDKYFVTAQNDRESFTVCGNHKESSIMVLGNGMWRSQNILSLLAQLTSEDTLVIFDTSKELYKWLAK
jgi:hypothetical protein